MRESDTHLIDRQYEALSGVVVGIPSNYALTVRWEGLSEPMSLHYADGSEGDVREETTTIHTLLSHPPTVKIGDRVTLWRDDPRG